MGVLSGPLLSLTASGTIGKTLTYSHWRGIKYVRSRVVPLNPDTVPQQAIRAVFRNMSTLWTNAPGLFKDPWFWGAKGRPMTDRNLLSKLNIKSLYDDAALTHLRMSPGTGGVPIDDVTSVVGGVGTITAIFNDPPAPDGFVFDSAALMVLPAGDPTTQLAMVPIIGTDGAPGPHTIVLTVDAGQYQYGIWSGYASTSGPTRFEFTPSVDGQVTAT